MWFLDGQPLEEIMSYEHREFLDCILECLCKRGFDFAPVSEVLCFDLKL